MKPGNLSERKRCQIRRQTKDEDLIERITHIGSSVCGFSFFVRTENDLLVLQADFLLHRCGMKQR